MLVALAAVASGESEPGPGDIQRALQTLNDPDGEVVGYGDFARAVEILERRTSNRNLTPA